jgi:hypothetical protein
MAMLLVVKSDEMCQHHGLDGPRIQRLTSVTDTQGVHGAQGLGELAGYTLDERRAPQKASFIQGRQCWPYDGEDLAVVGAIPISVRHALEFHKEDARGALVALPLSKPVDSCRRSFRFTLGSYPQGDVANSVAFLLVADQQGGVPGFTARLSSPPSRERDIVSSEIEGPE